MAGRQATVYQKVRDLLELAGPGQVADRAPAVVQIVAAAADSADSGVAGSNAGQRNRFLGFRQVLLEMTTEGLHTTVN